MFWTDFNPRKGAVLYIRDMLNRLSLLMGAPSMSAWHSSVILPSHIRSFSALSEVLYNELLPKETGFVVVTNPGQIQHGSCDLTAIASDRKYAMKLFKNAKEKVEKIC